MLHHTHDCMSQNPLTDKTKKVKHLSPFGGFHTEHIMLFLATILVSMVTEWTNQKLQMKSHDFTHPSLLVMLPLSSNRSILDKYVILGMLATILVSIATECIGPIRNFKWGHMTLTTHRYFLRFHHLGSTLGRTEVGRTPTRTSLIYYYHCTKSSK